MTFMHKLSQRLARLWVFAAIAAAVACEDIGVTDSSNPTVSLVQIFPKAVSLFPNQTAHLTLVGLTAKGDTVPQILVRWVTTGGTLVDTGTTGGAHYGDYKAGTQPGRFSVVAQSGVLADSSIVTVATVPVAFVAMSPAAATTTTGQTVQLTATPEDSTRTPLSGRVVTWSSSNAAVAAVTGTGLVTAMGAGTATVIATSESKVGTAAITVSAVPVASVTIAPSTANVPVGQTVQLTATTRDASGNVLTGRVITWSTSNAGVASVTGSGQVTGNAAGTSTITAASEGVSGTAVITVPTPVPVASVTIAPSTANVTVGQTAQLTATTRDASGNVLTGRVITWSTSNAGVASVNGSGLVTGNAAGTATITATSEGVNGTAGITVPAPAPVASVAIAPSTANVTVGKTAQLTATTRDASGNVLTGRVITWSTSNGGVASVNGSGLVSGNAAGAATITATSEGVNGTAAITVVNPVVKTVTVAPATSTLSVGQTETLVATAKDASGNLITGPPVTWVSGNTAIATISGAGVVQAVAVGTDTIRAQVDSITGTAVVTVQTITSVTAWLTEDFSTYTSTANLLSNPRGIYTTGEDVCGNGCATSDPGTIALDQSVGLNVGGYHLTQSMRYDQPASPECGNDPSVGRNIALPSTTQEVWVEIWVKFSAGWSAADPRATSCDPSYKFVFGRIDGSVGRFSLGIEDQSSAFLSSYPGQPDVNTYINYSGPSNPYSGFPPGDGNWHRYRFYWSYAHSTLQVWFDDHLALTQTGISISGSDIYGIALGRNINSGPVNSQSIWWGMVRAYNKNPGW
ncbi:MAG TPA: Ig-like domain-containing protein [Solirubrobacteraceae bacterium]|nr:Ig-like domain-containing protein [Solirubrobacteraceae bacterium]